MSVSLQYVSMVLVLIIVSTSTAFTQGQKSRQAGVTFSTLHGTGAHFLFPYTDKSNMKVSGLVLLNKGNGGSDSFVSIGGEYQRDVSEGTLHRLYTSIGGQVDNSLSGSVFFGEDITDVIYGSYGLSIGADYGNIRGGFVVNVHLTFQRTVGIFGSDRSRIGFGGGLGMAYLF
ncbi:MAG: hypothetical protein AAFW89_01315 [Bacteroidota bacterium]